jgi:RNA polymerase sigma factor (sigma-70 family)
MVMNLAGEPPGPDEDSRVSTSRLGSEQTETRCHLRGLTDDATVPINVDMTQIAYPLDQLTREIEAVRPWVLRHAQRASRDADRAEDAVQEAICRAIYNNNKLEPRRVGAWLTTVANRILIDESRRSSRAAHRLAGLAEEHHPDPAEEIVDTDTADAAREAMARLSPVQREVLYSVAAGDSIRDISVKTGLSIRSVEGHLRRARQLMRSWLS